MIICKYKIRKARIFGEAVGGIDRPGRFDFHAPNPATLLDHAIDLNRIAVALVMEGQGRVRPSSLRDELLPQKCFQQVPEILPIHSPLRWSDPG